MNKILKNFSFLVVVGLVSVLSSACAKSPDKSQVVAQVNNYLVTIDDFKHEAGMSISCTSKDLILQDIITKELLLEQAQKMGLDKNKYFMKEIEDYWKQSLIKALINIKGDEFLAASKVSADEVKAEYNRMSRESEGKIKPYEKISGQIEKEVRMKKAQVLLDSWINGLKKSASISKNDKVLDAIKLK